MCLFFCPRPRCTVRGIPEIPWVGGQPPIFLLVGSDRHPFPHFRGEPIFGQNYLSAPKGLFLAWCCGGCGGGSTHSFPPGHPIRPCPGSDVNWHGALSVVPRFCSEARPCGACPLLCRLSLLSPRHSGVRCGRWAKLVTRWTLPGACVLPVAALGAG